MAVTGPSSTHDVRAAIDVEGLASEPARVRGGEEGAGKADVHDVDQFAQRRTFGGAFTNDESSAGLGFGYGW